MLLNVDGNSVQIIIGNVPEHEKDAANNRREKDTLILKISCQSGGAGIRHFEKKLFEAFSQGYSTVMHPDQLAPKENFTGFREIRVFQCYTELEAIDFLRSKGFGITQASACC